MSDFIIESAPEPEQIYEPEPEPIYEPESLPVSDLEDALAEVELATAAPEEVAEEDGESRRGEFYHSVTEEPAAPWKAAQTPEDEARMAEEERIKEEQRKKEQEERDKEEAFKAEEARRKEELRKKLEERKKEKEQEHDLEIPPSAPAPKPAPAAVAEPRKPEPEEDSKKTKTKKPEPPRNIIKSGTDPRITKLAGNPAVNYLEMLMRHGKDSLFLIGAALYGLFTMALMFVRVGSTTDQSLALEVAIYVVILFAALVFAAGFLLTVGAMKGKIEPRKNARGLSAMKRASVISIFGWVGYFILHIPFMHSLMRAADGGDNILFIMSIAVAALGILVCVVSIRIIDSLRILLTSGKYVEHIPFILPYIIFAAAGAELIKNVMAIIMLEGELIPGMLGVMRVVGLGLMALVLMKFCTEYKKSLQE
jgi:hypothetical protein